MKKAIVVTLLLAASVAATAQPSPPDLYRAGGVFNGSRAYDNELRLTYTYAGSAFRGFGEPGSGEPAGTSDSGRAPPRLPGGEYPSGGIVRGRADGFGLAGALEDFGVIRYGDARGDSGFAVPYGGPGVDLGTIAIPVTIEAAGSLDPEGYSVGTAPAGTLRVSGGKIADFLSFDVVYRVRGGDGETAAAPGGYWANELGAYVGMDLFEGFGLGVGYAAAFDVPERGGGAVIAYTGPVFNGISLHLGYTGIENLAVSVTNNLSFARQQGGDGAVSFDGRADMREGWFALHNSLGVAYSITDKAAAKMSVSNRLGVYDTVRAAGNGYGKTTSDDLTIGVAGEHSFSGRMSFAAGLRFGFWQTVRNVQGKQPAATKEGGVSFAIPVQFKLSW